MSDTDVAGNFYTNEGQIADTGVAQELASLEKPARDREQALKRKFDTGLTETQKNNFEIMEGVEKKYPLAFEKHIDDKGRKVLSIPQIYGTSDQTYGLTNGGLIISQEGILNAATNGKQMPSEVYNFTELLDAMEGEDYKKFLNNNSFILFNPDVLNKKMLPDYIDESEARVFMKVDINDPRVQESLKGVFTRSQVANEGRLKRVEENRLKADPKTVLSNL